MKIFKKKRKQEFLNLPVLSSNEVVQIIGRYQKAAHFNYAAFHKYKGIYSDKSVVIIAAGPTAKNFIPFSANNIYMGMNRSFLLKNIDFNFLFAIDFFGISSFVDEFIAYNNSQNNCVKFIGEQTEGRGRDIPESLFLKMKHAQKYKTDIFIPTNQIPVDIDILPVWNSNSVAHQVFQFALFTNPKKIYLVGCDCNGPIAGHFIKGKNDSGMFASFSSEFWKNNTHSLIEGWIRLKDFAQIYYPDTKIISINPIGLKGVFEDVYTTSFLTEHPELRIKNINILEGDIK